MRQFLSLRARARAPLLLTCEHATHRLPPGIPTTPAERALLRTHWGWDLGAWAVTKELSRRRGASAIGGACSRLLIDLNRAVDDPTLIRTRAEGVVLSWNRRLTSAAVLRRIAVWHVAYHAALELRIASHLVRGIRPTILALHSFTPELDGARRDFEIGVLFREHASVARSLGRALARAGLRVRYNEPYSGLEGMMYSAERHGSQHALPCIELELNQRMLGEARALARISRTLSEALSASL